MYGGFEDACSVSSDNFVAMSATNTVCLVRYMDSVTATWDISATVFVNSFLILHRVKTVQRVGLTTAYIRRCKKNVCLRKHRGHIGL